MNKTTFFKIILVVIYTLSLATEVISYSQVNERKITVYGTCTIFTQPDKLRIVLGVRKDGKDPLKLFQEVTTKIDAIEKTIIRIGISKDEISLYHLSLVPQYDYDKKPPELIGYSMSYLLKVETKNLNMVSRVLDQALKAGVNVVSEISYFLSQEEYKKAYLRALDCAVNDAYVKARSAARSLGMKLGKAISVNIEEARIVFEYPTRADITAMKPTEIPVRVGVRIEYELVEE